MGAVQVWTTVLKFVALAFMSTVGLFFITSANFTPWNVSGESAMAAIGGAMAIALFSYLGVETAAVAAGKVRDPDRNVPRSTMLGTLATAVVYMLSLIAVFGILPIVAAGQTSTAPFSDAVNAMFGGTWAGNVMAVAVIISGFGALNGWTMICAEMPLAAANDGLFPERFKQLSRNGVPAFGIIASTALASIAMVINYLGLQRRHGLHDAGADDRHHRGHPVRLLRTGPDQVAARRPPDGAHAAVRARHGRRRRVAGLLAAVHLVLAQHRRHSFWVYWAPFLMAGGALLLGIPVYLPQRGQLTEPEPVPPYR